MIEFPLFNFDIADVSFWTERFVVVAVLVLVIPFIVIAITQLRLLNRFFRTPASFAWILIGVFLLGLTITIGTWYFLI